MGKLKNNPMMNTASGMVGDTVVFKRVRGSQVVANRPAKSGKQPNAGQLERQKRFKNATQYANAVLLQPDMKERYQANVKPKTKLFTARLVAMSDFLNSPIVGDIDTLDFKGLIGDQITIEATDDFEVVRVQVNILSNGVVVESGDAVKDPVFAMHWKYTATTAVTLGNSTIRVTALDNARNKATKELAI